jgi:hypothetical protein
MPPLWGFGAGAASPAPSRRREEHANDVLDETDDLEEADPEET